MVNILILDDVKFIRIGIMMTLEKEQGLNFFEAATVDQAIKVLEKNDIDLILLDLDLSNNVDLNPENKGGLDLIKYMKEYNMSIPHVVILSGTVNENKICEAYKLGIKEGLLKPYTAKALMDVVDRVKLDKSCGSAV